MELAEFAQSPESGTHFRSERAFAAFLWLFPFAYIGHVGVGVALDAVFPAHGAQVIHAHSYLEAFHRLDDDSEVQSHSGAARTYRLGIECDILEVDDLAAAVFGCLGAEIKERCRCA